MTPIEVDFAVVGNSPLALLLAALLAGTHKQKIVLIGQPPSPFSLAGGLALSVAPLTRPETWSMLAACVPETEKLIAHLGGKAALLRADPMFLANSASGVQALSHIRHMAHGFGHPVERVSSGEVNGQAIRWRDALWLNQVTLTSALLEWLDDNKISQHQTATLATRRDGKGRAVFNAGEHQIAARNAVLADDGAIVANLAPAVLQSRFNRATGTSILTEPTTPLAATVMVQIDSGVQLSQGAAGGIAATSPLAPDRALPQLAGLLKPHRHLRLAGQDQFTHLATRHGAPLVGTLTPSGPTILAGLGLVAPFLAPALARYLVGQASIGESTYFADRGVGAGPHIGDYSAVVAA
ncbi:hypothetical protein PSQ19_00570 [Devosia algicola]|uniref:FAD-binding domain-containing protein n=1 Tax=Devosia algicola TaxID=3026418 RepID=A0ABY7YP08_9HYPH|nr:hypothetical protein [Devosia algicola]WDR02769.1 hypothetical protein PSQ19_00570 [Devosia algicola]